MVKLTITPTTNGYRLHGEGKDGKHKIVIDSTFATKEDAEVEKEHLEKTLK